MQDATIQAIFDAATDLASLAGSLHRRVKRGEAVSADDVLAIAARLQGYAANLQEAARAQP